MASVDSYNNINPWLVLPPALLAATTSKVVDMIGYESVTFVISTGVITDGSWAITVSDGALVGGPFTQCPAPGATSANYPVVSPLLSDVSNLDTDENLVVTPQTLPGPFTNDGWNDQVFRVGYVGSQRFVEFTLTKTGGTTGGIFSVVAEQGCPHFAPTPANFEPANNE